MQCSDRVVGALTLTLMTLASRGTAQQILFSNLGTNQTYNTTSSYAVQGPTAFGEWQYVADEFTPTVSGNLSSLTLPLSVSSPSNSLTIHLMTDANGIPGQTLESFAWNGVSSASGSLATVNSTVQPMLTSGTDYWLALIPTGNNAGNWYWNSTSSTGIMADNSLGLWSVNPNRVEGAFQLTGTTINALGDPSFTPEPGSFALLAALALVGKTVWRRKVK